MKEERERKREREREKEKEKEKEKESAINANYLQTYGKIIIMMLN